MTTPAAEQPFSETPCTGQHAATMWTWARALTNGGADVEAPKESTYTPLDNAIRLVVQAGRASRAARARLDKLCPCGHPRHARSRRRISVKQSHILEAITRGYRGKPSPPI